MLLLDRASSSGIYLRPRPGRLEICGEFADGVRLRAVSAFVAGSVRATARGLGGERALLPPALFFVRARPRIDLACT